jgi:flavin reductase (DIM6/NTAB) family NADH-FMN oxidoreductase RutF
LAELGLQAQQRDHEWFALNFVTGDLMITQPLSFDSRQFRDALGRFVTGVTVVTTRDAHGKPHGVTVNSFTSVSVDPPLVLWCQALKAASYPVYNGSAYFAVNILAEHQIDVSSRFATSGADKFADMIHDSGMGQVPILPEVVAHLECRKVASYIAGDHVIFVGQVERLATSEGNPLVFSGGQYMRATPHNE